MQKLNSRELVTIMLFIAIFFLPMFIVPRANESKRDSSYYDMRAPIPTNTPFKPTPTPQSNRVVAYYKSVIKGVYINSVPVSATLIQYDYLGTYYITAYCACMECCGSTSGLTASGEYCHYSDDNYEPTTCAIDRNHHSFGELLLVDGKVYITEDTGSAVKGKHIDVYLPDHDDVEYFGSHYTEVYSVEYITTEGRRGKHYDINRYINDNSRSDWIYARNVM